MPTLGRDTKRRSAPQSVLGVPTQDCKLSNNCFTAALPSLIDAERHPVLSVLRVSNPQTCCSTSHAFPVSTLEIRTPGCGSSYKLSLSCLEQIFTSATGAQILFRTCHVL